MPLIKYKNAAGDSVPSWSAIGSQWGEGAKGLQWWYWQKGKNGLDFNEMPEAEVGSIAHQMIDYEVKAKELDLSQFAIEKVEQAQQCFDNWHEWVGRNKFKPVQTELSLISEEHQFGGTIDCIAMINDKLSILDVKTGKEVYASQVVQIVAYAQLWHENFPEHKLDGGYHIIRTGKEMASFVHYWYQEFPQAWEVFLHLRALYDLAKVINKLK